jgi:hypothetical protein
MEKNKSLGILLSGLFYMLAGYFFLIKDVLFYPSICIAIILTLVTILKPEIITPLTRIWFALSNKMAGVINPITLGVFFFLIITPIGLVSKIFGRDEMRLKRKNKKSYWIEKANNSLVDEPFRKQF